MENLVNNEQEPVVSPMPFYQLSDAQQKYEKERNIAAKPTQENSVAVFFDPEDSEFVASGMFISYKNRLFVSTAKHVVEDLFKRPNAQIAWKPDKPGGDYNQGSFRKLSAAWAPCIEKADIAALLFHNVLHLNSVKSIDANMLSNEKEPRLIVPQQAWLVGCPLASLEATRAALNIPLVLSLMRLTTHVCYPCKGEHRVTKEWLTEKDIHVDWSESGANGDDYQALDKANGMSGSTLWIDDNTEHDIWLPNKLRVAGVAWHQDYVSRCIRVVPMGYWFDAADEALRLATEEALGTL